MSAASKLQRFRDAEVAEVFWKDSHWVVTDTSSGLVAWRLTHDGVLARRSRTGRPAVIRLEQHRSPEEAKVAGSFIRRASLEATVPG